jgi:branched-chain amino acid aminotransferase
MPEPTSAYFKGEFRPLAEARISIRSKVVQYGLGCFEGIRAYWNAEREQLNIFRLADHFVRMRQSCRILNLSLKESVERLSEIAVELIRRNGHREDVYIRPVFYNASEKLSPTFTDDNELAMYTLTLGKYFASTKGLAACVSSWRRVSDNMIPARSKPTAAYLNSALARFEAQSNGFDEAIFLTQDGAVSEGSAEHIFLVRNGRLVTPTSQEDNLDGITRRTLVEIVRAELGLEVEERRVSRTELYVAEEAFVCGTGVEVTPLASIDRRPIGEGGLGPITRKVMELYRRVVLGEEPKYVHWLTPVYDRP